MTQRNRIDAGCTFRSFRRACASRVGGSRELALLAGAMLALAGCATHPKPQSPPPLPLPQPANRAHTVPAPQKRVRVPPAPAPAHPVPVPGSQSDEQDKNRATTPASNSVDALAPGDVGYYMDVLQGRLKQVAGKSIGIGRQGDRIVLDLTSRMAFVPGSTQLNAGNHAILASLSRVLVEYRMTLVSVRVRATGPVTHAIDPRLSEQRAQAIANDLAEAGVGLRRIVIAGAGAENRARVELSLEPIVSPAGSGH